MKVSLTRREIGRLLQALATARASELEYIDCHRIGWSKRRGSDGCYRRIVPASERSVVVRSRAAIAAWAKLRKRLSEAMKGAAK